MKYHILVSTSSGVDITAVQRMLALLHCSGQVQKTDDILKAMTELPTDAVILGAEDFDLAAQIAARSYSAVLLLTEGEPLDSMQAACVGAGILTGSRDRLDSALAQLLSECVRLRSVHVRTNTLQQKLYDTRLVNRAKLLLMSRLQMSEEQAHRYIEKTAMDSGENRRDVALSIIRTYEE